MARPIYGFYLLILLILNSCAQDKPDLDPTGLWRATVFLEQDSMVLPFFLEFIKTDSGYKAAIYNGTETIVHHHVQFKEDSIVIPSPFFNSAIIAKMNKNVLSGYWVDSSRLGNYKLSFSAKFNLSERFSFNKVVTDEIDGVWQTVFSPNTADAYHAIGIFNTDANSTKGTFLTETGDYRFLEGGFGGGQLKLSAFDGSHAFLFEGKLTGDTIFGWFYSGKHHKEPFKAWRNDSATLQSPYALTELTSPISKVSFVAKDLDGSLVSYPSNQFKGKALLVQIMGSWCPNCMDEAAFLAKHYSRLKDQNIEVLGLAFERLNFDLAVPVLKKLKQNLNVPYPIFYAGMAGKKEAQALLPFLKEIKSYPTLLFIKPDGSILKIHTGFYGPGTGKYFEIQSKEMIDDFDQLHKVSFP